MSTRSSKTRAGRFHGTSSEIPLYVAFAIIAIASVGLAYLALSGVHVGARPVSPPAPNSYPSEAVSPSATPTPIPTAESGNASMSLVGAEFSAWWTGSVGAGAFPGVIAGPLIGERDADIERLRNQLAESDISPGQLVVIQAGAQDIREGASSEQVLTALQGLWQSVRDRGGRPIAALLPPSNSFPAATLSVNGLIKTAAVEQGLAVIDVTTPVSAGDGTWVASYSDDGVQSNGSGTSAMVQAAVLQLSGIVSVPQTTAAG